MLCFALCTFLSVAPSPPPPPRSPPSDPGQPSGSCYSHASANRYGEVRRHPPLEENEWKRNRRGLAEGAAEEGGWGGGGSWHV